MTTPYWKLRLLRNRIIKRNASRWLYFFLWTQPLAIISMPFSIIAMFFVPPAIYTLILAVTMGVMVAGAAGYGYFYIKMQKAVLKNEGRRFLQFVNEHG